MSPPTAAPSPGSGAASTAWAGAVNVEGSSAAAGREDAPPELDALRPAFSKEQHQQAAKIPSRRRLPISLAPVGVRTTGESTNSAPLPSLSSAMSSAPQAAGAGAGLPRGGSSDGKPSWVGGSNTSGEEWHQQQQQQIPQQQPHYSRQFAELARPRKNLDESAAGSSPSAEAGDPLSSPGPAPSPSDVGVRPKIEIDAGSPAVAGGGDTSIIKIGAGAAAAAAAAARSSSSRAEGGSYHRSRKAYIQNRSLSSGGDKTATVRIGQGGEDGQRGVSRHARRFSSGGEFSNGAVGGVGAEFDRYGGGALTSDATNRRNSSAGAGRVRIRGGGIAITSLLSSEDAADGINGEGRGRAVRSGGGNNSSTFGGATTPGSAPSSSSAPSYAFSSYQRQESTASSVGDFTYTPLGSGAASASSSRAGTPGGGEGPPGGRPPLVRKRSLTVAMDDGPGGAAICPSPRGRRRSVDGVLDTKEGNPDSGRSDTPTGLLESPSRPPRLMAVGSNGVVVAGGNGNDGGGGGVGGGCFSPLISYPSPHGDRAAGREYALRSPAHDKLSVTVSGPAMTGSGSNANSNANTAGTGTPTTLASTFSAAPSPTVAPPPSAASEQPGSAAGRRNSAMEVEWIPNENAHVHHARGGVLPAPSPVTSAPTANASASSSSIGRPPSPYPPSPGREHRRAGGVVPQPRGTPHSPSPRGGPPPSPAQAPGSAGWRRRGARRLSGGRSTPRGVRARSRVGKGVHAGGAGGAGGGGAGAGSGEGSGTYESDYDSDLSETSAYSNYSAMGSLERQLQQDTFFELDELLWRVVTRREVRCCVGMCVFFLLLLQ